MVNEQVERFQAVTADDVNRIARARLGRDNRASLLYVPRETPEGDGPDGAAWDDVGTKPEELA